MRPCGPRIDLSAEAPTQLDSRHPLIAAVFLAILVAALNVGLWWWSNLPQGPADWHGQIGGFAVSLFQRHQSPLPNNPPGMQHAFPSDKQIASDLKLLAQYTDHIRVYSSLQNPQVYRLAKAQGLDVLGGAWLDTRKRNNNRELNALIAQARRYPETITRVEVGNEALLRHDFTPEQMMAYLDRARAAIRQPVSTAEPWHIWEKYPELVKHVDFITVHLLPYWQGVPRKDAIGEALMHYRKLQQLYPDKPIVVGEVGWPSNGNRFRNAKPSLSNEAIFLRRWFHVARRLGIDYYVMEAFDQPWKQGLGEGRTGAYWGMFNADRQLKFPFTGPVTEDTGWPYKALAAVLLALIPMLWFAVKFSRFKLAGRFFYMALIQLAAGLVVWSSTLPFNFYLGPLDWSMLILLFPAQIAILAVLLINGFE